MKFFYQKKLLLEIVMFQAMHIQCQDMQSRSGKTKSISYLDIKISSNY